MSAADHSGWHNLRRLMWSYPWETFSRSFSIPTLLKKTHRMYSCDIGEATALFLPRGMLGVRRAWISMVPAHGFGASRWICDTSSWACSWGSQTRPSSCVDTWSWMFLILTSTSFWAHLIFKGSSRNSLAEHHARVSARECAERVKSVDFVHGNILERVESFSGEGPCSGQLYT